MLTIHVFSLNFKRNVPFWVFAREEHFEKKLKPETKTEQIINHDLDVFSRAGV